MLEEKTVHSLVFGLEGIARIDVTINKNTGDTSIKGFYDGCMISGSFPSPAQCADFIGGFFKANAGRFKPDKLDDLLAKLGRVKKIEKKVPARKPVERKAA